MAKKYRYNVGLMAEGHTLGTIDLTKKEAEIVERVVNPENWSTITLDESWSGSFWIDIDNPMEIEK